MFINNNKINSNAKNVQEEGRKNLWSDEQLHTAVENVSSGELKAQAAAEKYGLPSSTLYKSTKWCSGAPTVLTAAEEKKTVTVLQTQVIC